MRRLCVFIGITFAFILPTARCPAAAANASDRKFDHKMNLFIDALIKRMTLEEKAGQMTQDSANHLPTGPFLAKNYTDDIAAGRVGSLLNANTPAFTREMQKIAVEKSRLKIPLLFALDVIHGYRTVFPIPLAESASWDFDLMEKTARASADEAAADGIQWTFAPMLDVGRDPRWGRVSEGPGEDPVLAAKFARAKVHGFQGDKFGAIDHVIACAKHFAGYGTPIGGLDYNSAQVTEAQLFESYFPPFRAAIDSGVATVMPAFTDIDGIPAVSNQWLLQNILRDKLKFKGLVVSDWGAVHELIAHGVASDDTQAALLALKAGVDIDMEGQAYIKAIPQLVKAHKISEKQIDQSVKRILELKYRLGLFSDPYRYSVDKRAEEEISKPEHIALAREAGRRSIVLLKNEGSILPLRKSATVALIGPLADDVFNMKGPWANYGDDTKSVTIRRGFAEALAGHGKLLYARGANIVDPGPLFAMLNHPQLNAHLTEDPRSHKEMIDEAVRVAKDSDVVVLALGSAQSMATEAGSRTQLTCPENQRELFEAVRTRAKKPIILLVTSGQPLVLKTESDESSAVLETWFLGTEAGHAIADTVFGDSNPSARLTTSFPVNEGQIPIFYAHRPTGRPHVDNLWYTTKYLDAPLEPLYPFGFGLSYTTFKYSAPRLSSEQMHAGQTLKVSVDVTNSGPRDGIETVQLYIRENIASVAWPLKTLRGFRQVHLKAGETQTISLELTIDDLKFYNREMKWTSEPGPFSVFVGPNSQETKEALFTLTAKVRRL